MHEASRVKPIKLNRFEVLGVHNKDETNYGL